MKKLFKSILLFFSITIFLNACDWKIVNESEQNKINQNKVLILQQSIALQTVVYYEDQASLITIGEKKVCQEERILAEQFLKDLKTINDALPEGEKILNQDGRLINLEKASGRQKVNIQLITESSTGNIETNLEEVKQATERLSKRMSAMKNNYLKMIIILRDSEKK